MEKDIIHFLDRPERKRAFPPEEVLHILPLEKAHTILDLGAGTGYFTIPAAQIVDGMVYALDKNPDMLEIIATKAQDKNITNIHLLEGSLDNIPLPDGSVNILLASLVLHEVPPLSHTLAEMKRVLKEGGYFLCLEYDKLESFPDGPPMHVRIPSPVMEQEIKNAGFKISRRIHLRDGIYVFTAEK